MLVLGLEGTMMEKESKYDYFDLPKQRESVKIKTYKNITKFRYLFQFQHAKKHQKLQPSRDS